MDSKIPENNGETSINNNFQYGITKKIVLN